MAQRKGCAERVQIVGSVQATPLPSRPCLPAHDTPAEWGCVGLYLPFTQETRCFQTGKVK